MEIVKIEGSRQRIEALSADLSGSAFEDVKLAGATFEDVNLAEAKFSNVNLSGSRVENADLSGLRISQADLTGAAIVDCVTDAMTIDGILVADLLAAYRLAHPGS